MRSRVFVAFVLAGAAARFGAACLADLPAAPGAGTDGGAGDGATVVPSDSGGTSVGSCGDGVVQRARGEACDPGDAGEAGVIGCTSQCTIDCDGGHLYGIDDHCYFAVSSATREEDASAEACASNAAHLVTFSSDDERDEVSEWLDKRAGFYWIGLQRDMTQDKVSIYPAVGVNEPGWAATCTGCYAASHLFSAKSFLDVCNGFKSAGDCVAGSANSDSWTGVRCDADCADAGTTTYDICEREPFGSTAQSCDDGGASCVTIKSTSSIYELVVDPAHALNATDATRQCATKHGASGRPGHLVVFNTAEERESVSRELAFFTNATSPTLAYWVGLSRVGSSGAFTWADSAAVDEYPLEWANGQPADGDFAYAEIGTSFDRQLLQTSEGTESRAYLCELE